jgi:metal-responsive CopG/Arc/MetJ family transcriptional regulator
MLIKEFILMRVTLNLPDPLIDDLIQVSGEKKKNKAICLAIEEYIRRRGKEKFLSLSGKINIDLDWKKMEELELKGMRQRAKPGKPRSPSIKKNRLTS